MALILTVFATRRTVCPRTEQQFPCGPEPAHQLKVAVMCVEVVERWPPLFVRVFSLLTMCSGEKVGSRKEKEWGCHADGSCEAPAQEQGWAGLRRPKGINRMPATGGESEHGAMLGAHAMGESQGQREERVSLHGTSHGPLQHTW